MLKKKYRNKHENWLKRSAGTSRSDNVCHGDDDEDWFARPDSKGALWQVQVLQNIPEEEAVVFADPNGNDPHSHVIDELGEELAQIMEADALQAAAQRAPVDPLQHAFEQELEKKRDDDDDDDVGHDDGQSGSDKDSIDDGDDARAAPASAQDSPLSCVNRANLHLFTRDPRLVDPDSCLSWNSVTGCVTADGRVVGWQKAVGLHSVRVYCGVHRRAEGLWN